MPQRTPPFEISGHLVKAGTRAEIEIPLARLPSGTHEHLPVSVLHGSKPGPTVWVSAAIHGDEINGVEIIRRLVKALSPSAMTGTLLAVPIVNVFGFISGNRYLPDRRDLNRSFPGSRRGSLAGRIAYIFMSEIVAPCSFGIDLHTGSGGRTNLPQIRANLDNKKTLAYAKAFGAPIMIHSPIRDGSMRDAANARDIPVLLLEAGEANRFDNHAIEIGVAGVQRCLALAGLVDSGPPLPASSPHYSRKSAWVRARRSGLFHRTIELGAIVEAKRELGFVADAFGVKTNIVRSPADGMVVGCCVEPLVNQGDALVHIALLEDPPK